MTLNGVDRYPLEDKEMRACSRQARLGGNATNTAQVLAGLGRVPRLLATLAPDADAGELRRLLLAARVNTEYLVTRPNGHTPVSLHPAVCGQRFAHHRPPPRTGGTAPGGLPSPTAGRLCLGAFRSSSKRIGHRSKR